MVNSKKNTKSIIALVVLSLLLIASICLAATGAWFTANVADKSDTVKFGKIEMAVDGGTFEVTGGTINDTANYMTNTQVMPGDTVNMTATVKNTGDKAYLFVKYDVSGSATVKGTADVKLGGEALNAVEGETSVYYIVMDKEDTTGKAFSYSLVLTGADYDNTYMEKDITVTVSFAEVQYANFADAKAAYAAVNWHVGA